MRAKQKTDPTGVILLLIQMPNFPFFSKTKNKKKKKKFELTDIPKETN